ncbi:MAG: hypothetical protein MZV63_53600 [Marinilabiliales bacterium]|nr:hypothetical protein [Marinilabiliales bacterium]
MRSVESSFFIMMVSLTAEAESGEKGNKKRQDYCFQIHLHHFLEILCNGNRYSGCYAGKGSGNREERCLQVITDIVVKEAGINVGIKDGQQVPCRNADI